MKKEENTFALIENLSCTARILEQFTARMSEGFATEAECNEFIEISGLVGWFSLPADSNDEMIIKWYPVPDHGAPALTLESMEQYAHNYFLQSKGV